MLTHQEVDFSIIIILRVASFHDTLGFSTILSLNETINKRFVLFQSFVRI